MNYGIAVILEYSKIHDGAHAPDRANPSDAGIDVFFSPGIDEPQETVIEPTTSILLGTGLKFGIPHGYMLEVKNRSSWAYKFQLLVGACVIDSGYLGEVMINLHNVGSLPRVVKSGDKIAQIVMIPVIHFRPHLTSEEHLYEDELCVSSRGTGGFGSTG